ncbi:MAG: hypothetical protein JWN07_3107 [Hyphomicrobiales bacterium]|nr:hypothetical protein [Hyphomicrobiales bacterium]
MTATVIARNEAIHRPHVRPFERFAALAVTGRKGTTP